MKAAIPFFYQLKIVGLASVLSVSAFSSGYAQTVEQPKEQPSAKPSEQPSEKVSEQPRVTMTIFFVPETVACRGSSYPGPCEPWKYSQIEELRKGRIGKVIGRKTNVLPGEVTLGAEILNRVSRYSQVTPAERSLKDRRAILILFDWNRTLGTQNKPASVSLTRESPSDNVPPAKQVIRGSLRGYQTWIYHERADSFLPEYQVKWTLKVDKYDPWIIQTR